MRTFKLLAIACILSALATTGSGGCRSDGPASQSNIPNSPPDAQTVLLRMRKHYGGLKTAVLSVKMQRILEGKEDNNRDVRAFGPFSAYFKSPNLYSSSVEQTRKLFPIPKSQVESYGRALIDPAFSYLIIFPQLFQGFQIADTFQRKSYGGQESLKGEKTDRIIFERDLKDPSPSGPPFSGSAVLTLWVNEKGQLKKFDSALHTTIKLPDSPGVRSTDYSFIGEITETDNGALPKSFYKKAPPKKPAKAAKPRS